MKILTFDHPIKQVVHLPGAMIVTTTKDKRRLRTKYYKHFLVKDDKIQLLTHLKNGQVYLYERRDSNCFSNILETILSWRHDTERERYLNEKLELVGGYNGTNFEFADAFRIVKHKEYVTVSLPHGGVGILGITSDIKTALYALSGADIDSPITIFIKDSKTTRVFAWDKPYNHFEPSHDALTFVGYNENELIFIDNPFM